MEGKKIRFYMENNVVKKNRIFQKNYSKSCHFAK